MVKNNFGNILESGEFRFENRKKKVHFTITKLNMKEKKIAIF